VDDELAPLVLDDDEPSTAVVLEPELELSEAPELDAPISVVVPGSTFVVPPFVVSESESVVHATAVQAIANQNEEIRSFDMLALSIPGTAMPVRGAQHPNARRRVGYHPPASRRWYPARVEDGPSDQALLEAWRRKDEEAGSRLVRRHFDAVARFLERRVDATSLPDLIQTIFVALVESREKIPEGVNFRAYLLGIARNKMLMHRRKRRYTLDDGELVKEPAANSLHRPSRAAAAREEERLLLRALSRLELDLQIALELFYWEDMGTPDIAHALGIPRGTVKTRLARARRRLREMIEADGAPLALAESTVRDMDKWVSSIRGKIDRP
jgi:RNA polymerase sigma factor (sigma-70 family)